VLSLERAAGGAERLQGSGASTWLLKGEGAALGSAAAGAGWLQMIAAPGASRSLQQGDRVQPAGGGKRARPAGSAGWIRGCKGAAAAMRWGCRCPLFAGNDSSFGSCWGPGISPEAWEWPHY
jgi:hypothetical protein